jgi:hypothetical protein
MKTLLKQRGRPVQYKIEADTKVCSRCHQTKPVSEFTERTVDRTRGGEMYLYKFRAGQCKDCVRTNAREWQREHKPAQRIAPGEYDFVFSSNVNDWH